MQATPNKRLGRPTKAAWDKLPTETRLTLEEAAAIIGIERETIRREYCAINPRCTLPAGIVVIRDRGRAAFLVRREPVR